jgi:methyl-accepting chemotaxis protein
MSIFADLKIGLKLVIGFSMILLWMIVSTVISTQKDVEINATTQRLMDETVPVSNKARDAIFELVSANGGIRGYVGSHDTIYLTSVPQYEAALDQDLKDIESHYSTQPELRDVLESKVKPLLADVRQTMDATVQAAKDGHTDEALRIMRDSKSKMIEFRAAFKDVFSETDKSFSDAAKANRSALAFKVRLNWTLTLLAADLAMAIATSVVRSIVNPIRKLQAQLRTLQDRDLNSFGQAIDAMAAGDLTRRTRVESEPLGMTGNNEVSEMARTFDDMLRTLQSSIRSFGVAQSSLCRMVQDVAHGARSIATTSELLATAAEHSGAASADIASGSEKLALGATEASSIMAKLAEQVEAIERDSNSQQSLIHSAAKVLGEAEFGITKVASAAETMAGAAAQGHDAVLETMQAMGRVQERVDYSARKVQELDERGRQIGRIVQSIQGIAEQTNLLALNAAIEAARAGEHGKGFAVVADEVRKLAEQAAKATGEIGSLIENVTATVEDTVSAIHGTTTEVADGTTRSTVAGQALQQILAASEDVAARSQEVCALTNHASATMDQVAKAARDNSHATCEMTKGADLVALSISGVAAVSEETAAGAEELTATIHEVSDSAVELSKMSAGFDDLVAQFKFADDQDDRQLLKAA